MIKEDVNANCCICDSKESTLLYEIDYPQYGYPGTFSVRRCSGCGLIFNSPRLTQGAIDALYEKNYYFFNRPDEVEFKRIIVLYRRIIKPLAQIGIKKDVLEIGSAKGYLLALLKGLGWSVCGIEISSAAADYAKTKFGISVHTGTLKDYVDCPGHQKFYTILAIDVLEHIPDPENFLKQICELMNKDGILIIQTPNGNSKNIVSQKGTWKGFNPYHIFIFNPENLERLLVKTGFSVQRIFSYGNCEDTLKNTVEPKNGSLPAQSSFIKQFLKRLGVYSFLCNIIKLLLRGYCRKIFLKRAIEEAEKEYSYFDMPDSWGPFAETRTGDNFVIWALKK